MHKKPTILVHIKTLHKKTFNYCAHKTSVKSILQVRDFVFNHFTGEDKSGDIIQNDSSLLMFSIVMMFFSIAAPFRLSNVSFA